MSDAEIVTCPADDCDYTGPKSSVLGHYSGKTDGLHPGGYGKAKALLEDTGVQQQSEQDSSPDVGETSDMVDEQAQNPAQDYGKKREQKQLSHSDGDNPTMGGAEAVNEPDPAPSDQDPRRQERPRGNAPQGYTPDDGCLDCGGELVDFTDLPTGTTQKVGTDNVEVFVAGDYVCSRCGEWYTDE